MMNIARFRHLLDAYGADFSAWPAAERAAAENLLATDPDARAYKRQAQRLDERIMRGMTATSDASSAEQPEAITGRVLDALAGRPLPPQRRGLLPWRWPAVLLDVDLAPAWPRIAALACATCLGVGLGLSGAGMTLFEGRSGVAIAATEIDLGLGFDPEPLTGGGP